MEALRYAEQIAQLVLVASLFCRGLAKSYSFFTTYLVARVLRAASLLTLNYHGMPYAKAWAVTEPILLILQSLVVLELAESILEYYPEIAHLAKVLIAWSLLVGTLIGGSLALVAAIYNPGEPLWLAIVMGAWKWSSLSCALTLVVQSAWFSAFPLPMKSNVAIHRWLLTIFIGFVPACSAFLVELRRLRFADQVVLFQLALETGCCLGWILLLRRAGEQIRYRPDWNAREEHGRIRREYLLFIENLRRKLSLPQVIGE
jgi:hypothetical protein